MYFVMNIETRRIVKPFWEVSSAEHLRVCNPEEPWILVAVIESNIDLEDYFDDYPE